MALSSEVATRSCFAWKIEQLLGLRFYPSSCFIFLGAEWRLEMSYDGAYYYVYLLKMTEWNDFHPFEVTSWFQRNKVMGNPIRCTKVTITSASDMLWCIPRNLLLEKIPVLTGNGDFTFFFVPQSESLQSGQRNETEHQSIQVCLDSPPSLNSLSLDSRCPPGKEPSDHNSIQTCLEFSADLEVLSLDLGKLLEKGALPDVELKCGDIAFPAHRAVLSARSDVFSAMFSNDMSESRTGIVNVPDVDQKVLELLLKYIYTGKLHGTSEDLIPKLFTTSNKYAVHGLKKVCSDRMTGGLTEENCVDYLVLADAHSDASFKDAVMQFIVDNKDMLLNTTEWFQFSEEQPKLALDVYRRSFAR